MIRPLILSVAILGTIVGTVLYVSSLRDGIDGTETISVPTNSSDGTVQAISTSNPPSLNRGSQSLPPAQRQIADSTVSVERQPDGTWNIPTDLNDIRWPISPEVIDGKNTFPHISMPALPGLSGYEVSAYSLAGGYPSEAFILAEEVRDPAWAGLMESQIYDEISRSRRTLGSVNVECRKTRCGVVYIFPADSRGGTLGRIDQDFAQEVGMHVTAQITSRTVQGPFTAIYLSSSGPANPFQDNRP